MLTISSTIGCHHDVLVGPYHACHASLIEVDASLVTVMMYQNYDASSSFDTSTMYLESVACDTSSILLEPAHWLKGKHQEKKPHRLAAQQ